ncbi:hypothetical protein Tco_1144496 [Tanacetum coccineum]
MQILWHWMDLCNTKTNPKLLDPSIRVKDTTTRDRAVVSENKKKGVNAVKASACWVWKAKNSSAGQPTAEGVQGRRSARKKELLTVVAQGT